MPVDDTDWCCWTHDCCYDKLALEGCDPKGTGYRYMVYHGIVACGGYPKECGRKTCECDKAASLCFRKNFKTYKMKNMFKRDSTCKGQKPACTRHSDASANSQPSSTDSASEKYTTEAQAHVRTETSDTSKQV
ncbi:basic phospholipase A2 homolog [Lissotriton helveticus]